MSECKDLIDRLKVLETFAKLNYTNSVLGVGILNQMILGSGFTLGVSKLGIKAL